MTKLELLYAQKSKKFDQLCAVAARELGYGELSALSVQDRIRVDDQVEQYVEQWEETVEMRTGFTIRPITSLRRLLAEYQDIANGLSMSTRSTPVFGPIARVSRAPSSAPLSSSCAWSPAAYTLGASGSLAEGLDVRRSRAMRGFSRYRLAASMLGAQVGPLRLPVDGLARRHYRGAGAEQHGARALRFRRRCMPLPRVPFPLSAFDILVVICFSSRPSCRHLFRRIA